MRWPGDEHVGIFSTLDHALVLDSLELATSRTGIWDGVETSHNWPLGVHDLFVPLTRRGDVVVYTIREHPVTIAGDSDLLDGLYILLCMYVKCT